LNRSGQRAAPRLPVRRRGLMFVLSSPSGAGKTTISRALLRADKALALSVSVTTRPKRPGERNGVDYHFIDKAAFDRRVARRQLLEHAKVFDHFYGTPAAPVNARLAAGLDVLFDIDWQGTRQLRRRMRRDVVAVFILPPSLAALGRRLKRRAQDSPAAVARRMAGALREISHWKEYDYVVVNDDLARCLAGVAAILRAERARRDRQTGLREFVSALRSRAARGKPAPRRKTPRC
jgi:guanylate kinase